MLSAPIFVYSEKSAKEYLATAQINKDTNTLGLLTLKGVEYSAEEDYFKVQNFFLTESFDDGTSINTQFDESASLLLTTTNLFVALWGTSDSNVSANLTTTNVQGVAGYLSCAFYEETEAAKTATLTFDTVSSVRSVNTSIGASDVILGSTTTGILTNARGNYLTGQNSYQNNPTFYPFSLNPGGTSRSYGSNTNSVPSNGYVKEIKLISNSSQQSQTYNNPGYTLNLKFDLWSGNQFISSKNIVLLNSGQNLQNIDALVHTIASEQDYILSSGIRFLNVNLVNVPVSTGTETAATTYYGLLLDTNANYYTTDNVNLITKPFIESPVFRLKDGSNVEFSGFDSITVTDVANPNNGIDVEVKLSSTEAGLNSANYVKLGTITTTGSSTVFLSLDDPAYEAARSAKFIQVKFSGVVNTATNTYLQASFNKAITLNQINLNRKQVLANDFVGQFKFSNGYESNVPVTLFGPFNIFTDKTDEMTALGNYTYGTSTYTYKNVIALNSVREGRLHFNFENYEKIYYIAKGNENNINTATVPTYTPSTTAITRFNSAPAAPTGYTKRLVFKYDIEAAQLVDNHWDSCSGWGSSYLRSRYGFHWIGESSTYKPPTVVTGAQKTVTVTIDGGGIYSLSDSATAKRYLATFDIKKTNVANYRKFFGFKFRNFREVVVYQNNTNPSDIIEASNSYRVSYGNNDPFKAATSGQAVATNGLWYAVSNQKYIDTKESVDEFIVTSPQPITRIALPSFTFDKFEGLAVDGTPRDFEARVLINYYVDGNNIPVARIVRAFTNSSLSETVIETPTAASASTRVGFKLLLIPKNVTLVEDLGALGADFRINNIAITKGKYLIPTISYFNDVGLNFSSKPRLEYLDNTSNTATKYKKYVPSIAVSKAYDLLSIADATEEVGNPPLLRTEVIYGGSVSKADGTDIVVEWSGKDLIGDSWSAWYPTTSDNAIKNKKYIRFKVTLIPSTDGRKAPVVDSLSVRFWPYKDPYVAYPKDPLNLAENISSLILTKFETKDVERDLAQLQLNVNLPANDYDINDLDQEQNIMQEIGVGDRDNDIVVKTIFLHEDARLRDAKVDLFYIP